MEGHAGEFMAPACLGHHDDTRGGKPPPLTVSSVQHSGAMSVFEWDASAHCAMQEGGGVKATAPDSRRGEGGHIQGFQCIWTPPEDGDIFQILEAGDLSGGRQLAGGSQKPGKGAGGVAEVD